MNITLNLTANEYIRHGEIITLPVDNVCLCFTSPYAIDELVVTVTPPEYEGVSKPVQIRADAEHKADITPYLTHAGKVNITATMVVRGVPVKIWQIEPFIVKEVSGHYVAITELEYLKGELETVKKAIAEIVKTIS